MSAQPTTRAGQALIDSHSNAAVYCGTSDERMASEVIAVEVEAKTHGRLAAYSWFLDFDLHPNVRTSVEEAIRDIAREYGEAIK